MTFESGKPQQPQQPVQRLVSISQVITEQQLIERSSQLEQTLVNAQYAEFCNLKIANSKDPVEENIWNFLKVRI